MCKENFVVIRELYQNTAGVVRPVSNNILESYIFLVSIHLWVSFFYSA
jgi:hypothetical protein